MGHFGQQRLHQFMTPELGKQMCLGGGGSSYGGCGIGWGGDGGGDGGGGCGGC